MAVNLDDDFLATGDFIDQCIYDGNSGSLTRCCPLGPTINMILADEQIDFTGTPGEVLCALTEHLGNTCELVDSTGAVAVHYSHDRFGSQTIISHAGGISFLFAFTGRELDQETYLYR